MITVLYFTADWCTPCRIFGPMLTKLSKELGFEIQEVDADKRVDLVRQYEVMTIPTTIWMKDGKYRKALRGNYKEPQVRALFAEL